MCWRCRRQLKYSSSDQTDPGELPVVTHFAMVPHGASGFRTFPVITDPNVSCAKGRGCGAARRGRPGTLPVIANPDISSAIRCRSAARAGRAHFLPVRASPDIARARTGIRCTLRSFGDRYRSEGRDSGCGCCHCNSKNAHETHLLLEDHQTTVNGQYEGSNRLPRV